MGARAPRRLEFSGYDAKKSSEDDSGIAVESVSTDFLTSVAGDFQSPEAGTAEGEGECARLAVQARRLYHCVFRRRPCAAAL